MLVNPTNQFSFPTPWGNIPLTIVQRVNGSYPCWDFCFSTCERSAEANNNSLKVTYKNGIRLVGIVRYRMTVEKIASKGAGEPGAYASRSMQNRGDDPYIFVKDPGDHDFYLAENKHYSQVTNYLRDNITKWILEHPAELVGVEILYLEQEHKSQLNKIRHLTDEIRLNVNLAENTKGQLQNLTASYCKLLLSKRAAQEDVEETIG